MNIIEGEIITLNNGKEYIVIKIIDINNIKYMSLVSNFKPLEVMIVKNEIINEKFVISEITDQKELDEVLSKM